MVLMLTTSGFLKLIESRSTLLIPVRPGFLVLLLQRLDHDRAQHGVYYVDQGQCHGDSRHPTGLVLQDPGELLDTPVNVGISSDSVSALLRQWMPVQDVIVGSISATATNLEIYQIIIILRGKTIIAINSHSLE